ncbi:hypothetical protein ABMA28_011688 [Loxostege sticticalis]|uniref:Peptidase A2 domain-containing protein n=1 Tax=Loxostege sticticalis TaxID=481309 RepID=A0ABD0TKB6_LOXSC
MVRALHLPDNTSGPPGADRVPEHRLRDHGAAQDGSEKRMARDDRVDAVMEESRTNRPRMMPARHEQGMDMVVPRGTTASGTDLPPGRTQRRGPRSTRSTASAAARLRYEAEEHLAAIRREEVSELEIKADLVRKKLASDLAELEDDSGPEDNVSTQNMDRVHEWLDGAAPDADAVRGERLEDAAPVHPAATPANRRARFGWVPDAQTARAKERRRSPTPISRGTEQLAETLSRILSSRPPPRQVTDLPIFSGSPMEWLQFSMTMEETTKLYKFSPLENLARLRNALRGEARDTVAALLSSATHPDEIMKTLQQCYGRPEILVDMAYEDLRKLPKMGVTAHELNTFAVKVQNIVAALRNVDITYLYNPLLVREILDKLSPHMKTKWYDYAEENSEKTAEIVKLSRFLMQQADRAQRHSHSGVRKDIPTRVITVNRTEKKKVFNVTETSKPELCAVCEGEHRLPNCAKYKDLTVSERWDIVKKAGLCFRCVSSRHRRMNCRQKACGVKGCRHPHHATLHSETKGTNEHADVEQATVTTTTTASDVKLKICPIIISGSKGTRRTFALFDEGATISLIDEELATEIGANGPIKCLRIKGIEDEARSMKSKVVHVKIKTDGGDYNEHNPVITLRTMAGLNLSTQSVPKEALQLEHLQGLDVASLAYHNAKPRVLIGTDNWPLIVTRELRANRTSPPPQEQHLDG